MIDPTSVILKAGDSECFSRSYVHAEYDSTVSFNSGHTCSKMQAPKHSKENSVSSNLH